MEHMVSFWDSLTWKWYYGAFLDLHYREEIWVLPATLFCYKKIIFELENGLPSPDWGIFKGLAVDMCKACPQLLALCCDSSVGKCAVTKRLFT